MGTYTCFPTDGVLYGLLEGHSYTKFATGEKTKEWNLHLYGSEKGRRQGMLYQRRQYLQCDIVSFELRLRDLLKGAQLQTVIPRELYVEGDVLRFLKEKEKR